MSKSQPVSEAESEKKAPARLTDPKHNPSYPARTHTHERAHWLSVLQECEDKIATIGRKRDALGNSPDRPRFDRLYAQMIGSRDQVADSVRRLPGETGDLYEEDKHRLEEAIAALDRALAQW